MVGYLNIGNLAVNKTLQLGSKFTLTVIKFAFISRACLVITLENFRLLLLLLGMTKWIKTSWKYTYSVIYSEVNSFNYRTQTNS